MRVNSLIRLVYWFGMELSGDYTEYPKKVTNKIKLTDNNSVSNLPISDQRINYSDSITTGLILRVTPMGVKTWTLVKKKDKIVKRSTLGRFPKISIEEAREKAMLVIKEWEKEG